MVVYYVEVNLVGVGGDYVVDFFVELCKVG